MFTLNYLTLASYDVEEIYDWYEKKRFGLGDEFLEDLDSRLNEISRNPFQCEEKFRGIRKAFTSRFPYVIYYKIYPDGLIIIHAVLHMSRHSIQWKSRVK